MESFICHQVKGLEFTSAGAPLPHTSIIRINCVILKALIKAKGMRLSFAA